MSNAKKLTLTELNKRNKELDGKKEILVSNGQYKVVTDKFFRNSKIKKMANEIQQCSEMILNDQTLNVDITKDASFLNYMLILRNFTNIPIPLDLKKMISICDILLDTGIFEELLSKAFTAEQLNHLNQELKKIMRVDEDADIQKSE